MRVLLLNGSPKANGNTAAALAEMVKIFGEEGIEAEVGQSAVMPLTEVMYRPYSLSSPEIRPSASRASPTVAASEVYWKVFSEIGRAHV